MALGQISDLSEIPFLSRENLAGRFISSLMFYVDGNWRVWLQTEGPGQKFIEVQAWPAETFYFGTEPNNQNDIHSAFLTVFAQHANFVEYKGRFSAIQDDILNLSASFAKLSLIHAGGDTTGGATRMVATEVEYILLVCRSMFDLFQELLAKLWETEVRADATRKKRALRDTFSGMALSDNKIRSADEIAKYGLPPLLVECYARHAPIFLKIRQFRDNLVHGGHQIQAIFRDERGFLIRKRLGPFLKLDIWRDDEVQPNDLAPLQPALGMIVHGTLFALEDFTHALVKCIPLPGAIVPNMNLYMRGYFNDALLSVLADANKRIAEGRKLVVDALG
jgi:hypothetical protein